MLSSGPGPIWRSAAPQRQEYGEDVEEGACTSSQSLSFQICKLGRITSHAGPIGLWDLPERRSEKELCEQESTVIDEGPSDPQAQSDREGLEDGRSQMRHEGTEMRCREA